MTSTEKTTLTVSAVVNAPLSHVWQLFTTPHHITEWNFASDDWIAPHAINDVRPGGKLVWRMEARDGSMGFDLEGTYTAVTPNSQLAYTMSDGRNVQVSFAETNGQTTVTEMFEAEQMNPLEMQQAGWQAILNNFKSYAEYTLQYPPLVFTQTINAPKQKVWDIMLQPHTYRQWAGAAWPGSYYEGEWKEGETMCFFSPEKSGTKIKLHLHRPYHFSKAEHIGCFDKGREDTDSPTAKGWIGSKENYLFTEENGVTTLTVIMYVTPTWHTIFTADFPKAFAKLKELCEA